MKNFIEFIRVQGVVGLAVGFVFGRAISDLVASFVNDIVNPFVGLALGSFGDLSQMSFHIWSASVNYGKFIMLLINFVIVALVVYFTVKKLRLDRLDKPKDSLVK